MTGRETLIGVAMALLILSSVVAIILIPVLDEQLRRASARLHANDNRPARPPGISSEAEVACPATADRKVL